MTNDIFKYVKYLYSKIYLKVSVARNKRNIIDVLYGMFDCSYIALKEKTSFNKLPREIVAICDKYYDNIENFSKIGKIKQLKTSVIVPHYNHEKYLPFLLDSLANSTELPDEVILIDDCSEHISEIKKIESLYKDKLSLKFHYSQEKLFTSGARNLGVKKASGDILIFIDSDDILHRDKIKVIKEFYKKYPDALSVTHGYVKIQEKFVEFINKFDFNYFDDLIILPDFLIKDLINKLSKQLFTNFKRKFVLFGSYGCNLNFNFGCQAGHVSCRREVFNYLSWSTEVFSSLEDYEFNSLVLLLGKRSYHIEFPLCYYRTRSSSWLRNKKNQIK